MALGRLGKYERLDVLGHGASGIVYLARDTLLGKQVAIKEIPVEGEERERFLTEARVLDRLRHPNIVHVNSVDQIDDLIVINMEYVRGRSLLNILRKTPRLSARRAFDIAAQVCDGLAYAHEHRTVHRDIKPANILVTDAYDVKIIDFGLAEVLGTHSMARGGGTYAYMAPEDFESSERSDRRSDIWAVGVVLYEMLAGTRPFRVENVKNPFAWRAAIEETPLTPVTSVRTDLPPEIDAIIGRALTRDKEQRYENASRMASELRTLASLLPDVDEPDETSPEQAGDTQTSTDQKTIPSILPGVNDIDALIAAIPYNWDGACFGIINGTLESWLRDLGEVPMADVAADLSQRNEPVDDRMREFLYQAGLELEDEARSMYREGKDHLDRNEIDDAVIKLKAAFYLDPHSDEIRTAYRKAAEFSPDPHVREAALALTGAAVSRKEPAAEVPRAKPANPKPIAPLQGLSLNLSSNRVDFGRLRQGEVKSVKVTLQTAGRGVLEGRIAQCPPWIHASPAHFTTRKRQSLTLTAESASVWSAPANYQEKVVLETSAGRKEIDVLLHVDSARLRLADMSLWYIPVLICCLLPAMTSVLASVLHATDIRHLWEPGFVTSGLLCGAFFALTVTAETALSERALPFLLMLLTGGAGAIGIIQQLSDATGHGARMALLATSPPAIALIVLQALALARDPNRWGRWQLWRWIIGVTGILIAYGFLELPR